MSGIKYPHIRRDESNFNSYHGQKVLDPYFWLEDSDSEETKKFVEDQNSITAEYLNDCEVKSKLYDRLKELWDYPKYGCPFKRGSRYFYFYNSGLQNQSVMYVQESWSAEAKVFLDPNEIAPDGTISIQGYEFSIDSNCFAYGLSQNGSDWYKIKFKDVSTKEDLPDVLENVKFSCMSWTHDNKGLFYNRYPKIEGKQDGTETSSNKNQKLYYHRMGTDQSEDILCAELPENPDWLLGAEVSEDGRYVLFSVRNGYYPVNKLYYVDLETLGYEIKDRLPCVKLIDNFDAEYVYIANNGTMFTFKTNLNAPKYKVINIDFAKPEMESWKTLIEEDEKDVIEWVGCVNKDKLVVCTLHDIKNKLFIHSLVDGTRLCQLPLDAGAVIGYSGQRNQTEIFYKFTSFLAPGTIFHWDLSDESSEPKVFREIEVKGFNASDYETEQVFVESKDGTKVPVFIMHKKGIFLDGNNPCLLYGYGGLNFPIMPEFSIKRLIFIQHLGGVLAIANIRGGTEYGEDWHRAGTCERKQNVFDDFQVAAEYLVKNKYTSSEKLAIEGRSNGGLLVAACANQRPELYKCVLCHVGLLDMLKFHKFTIGHIWVTEFGCADKENEFEYLINYSPLHNIRKPEQENSQYPAMLLLTADHDDTVVPLHSFKFISELQHVMGSAENQTNPLLIRIEMKAGHGEGKPTAMLIEEAADSYAFLAKNIGAVWKN
ncbi:prolyl endopeptidase-like [Rhopilema esculentum]|uniref:prolyl endopeptidase-like n=1 Tax=Rhopilema esculentum TaxID=499914 RepID=UPI0031D1965D